MKHTLEIKAEDQLVVSTHWPSVPSASHAFRNLATRINNSSANISRPQGRSFSGVFTSSRTLACTIRPVYSHSLG